MITVNELRIGNYVMLNLPLKNGGYDNYIVQITAVTPNKVYFKGKTSGFADISSISPISITGKILQRCGFIDGNLDLPIGNTIQYSGNCIFLYGVDSSTQSQSFEIECPISYVHQLQNLFYSLTGKELDVQPETLNLKE